jgi:hypothetical protein
MRRRHSDSNISQQRIKRKRNLSQSEDSKSNPYREIAHYEGKIKRFSTNYFVSEFIINHAISFPEEKLKDVFQELIDKAYRKANDLGMQVRKNINYISHFAI